MTLIMISNLIEKLVEEKSVGEKHVEKKNAEKNLFFRTKIGKERFCFLSIKREEANRKMME